MELPINVEDLILERLVESTRLDYKEGFDPKAVLHSICAFANDIDNTGGGYIIIGIEEDKGFPKLPPKGIEKDKVDGIMKDLVGYCNQIEPRYLPIVKPVKFQGKDVIVIWCPAGHGRPYKAPEDPHTKSLKRYYVRKLNSSIVAKAEEERELYYISSDIPFDDRPNLTATIDDIDVSLLRKHLRDSNSDLYEHSLKMETLEIAQSMQLVTGPDEALRPRNIALLMFNEDPERFFRGARIEFVDIPDPTGEGMVEKVFSGPIQRQLKDALQYIGNYVIREKVYKFDDKAEAKRVFNYPYRAIEELLTNAVYHKSYMINEPITVRLTPGELEITSFPGLDRSITEENIRDFKIRGRIYRNRRIGDFFKELKLTEGRNTGIPNAIVALKENDSPMPIFDMDEERRYVSVTLKVNDAFKPDSSARPKAQPPKRMSKAEIKSKALSLLKDGDMSLNELAMRMGYKGISKSLTLAIEELGQDSCVEQKKQGRSSVIKITKFGKRVADE